MAGFEGGSMEGGGPEIEVRQPEMPVQQEKVQWSRDFARERQVSENTFKPEFRGFDKIQQESVGNIEGSFTNIAESLGFYSTSIKTFKLIESQRLGSAGDLGGWFNFGNGELGLTREAFRHEAGLAGIMVHEKAHAASPFINADAREYYKETKGVELFEEATHEIIKVANQSLATGVYLNGYHRWLGDEFKTGRIGIAQIVEETSAILAEIRTINPRHLEQVNDSQRNKLLRFGVAPADITDLVQASNLQMHLMSSNLHSHNHADVEAYLGNVRNSLKANTTKIFEEIRGSNVTRQQNLNKKQATFAIGKENSNPVERDFEIEFIKALLAPRKPKVVEEEEEHRGIIWGLLRLLESIILANELSTYDLPRMGRVQEYITLPNGQMILVRES